MNQQRVRVNTQTLRDQMYKFRGKSEKNDRVDAFVNALTYAKDYESDGYKKRVNEFEGMTHQQIFVKRYMDRFRKETSGTQELFAEDALTSYTDEDYF